MSTNRFSQVATKWRECDQTGIPGMISSSFMMADIASDVYSSNNYWNLASSKCINPLPVTNRYSKCINIAYFVVSCASFGVPPFISWFEASNKGGRLLHILKETEKYGREWSREKASSFITFHVKYLSGNPISVIVRAIVFDPIASIVHVYLWIPLRIFHINRLKFSNWRKRMLDVANDSEYMRMFKEELPFAFFPEMGTEDIFKTELEQRKIQEQVESIPGSLLYEYVYEALPQLILSLCYISLNKDEVLKSDGAHKLRWAYVSAALSFISLCKGLAMGINSVRKNKATVNLLCVFVYPLILAILLTAIAVGILFAILSSIDWG